jgi:hypothetical protein
MHRRPEEIEYPMSFGWLGEVQLWQRNIARGRPMNDRDRNLRIAQTVRRDFAWNGQAFQRGDFVALLDGEVVAVERTADDAIAALRSLDPDPQRGMVVEVGPATVDVIRKVP